MEAQFEECPPRTNILVVDNCITTLLNMKRTITQFNFQVMIETNGERALSYLRNSRHEINIVIWDLHLPGINGIEALKVIASEMDLPVIIMSDDNQYDSVLEAIHHGACDYVLKPVPKEKIAFIWQHIVRKKMKSKPVSTGEEKIRNKEKSMKSTEWTEVKIQPFRRNLVQRNDVDQQKKHDIAINQDNGEVNIEKENATKKPRTEETQVVQTDRLQIEGLDQQNEDNGELNIDKAAKKPRTEETQVVQTEGLDQDKILSEGNNGEENVENKKEKKARRPRMFWTGDLHQRFLEAVELVGGIENANPRVLLRCMEDMNIEGLTRYNVASHLQKYRTSLDEAQISQYQTQEIGSSSSLLAPNNVHTASSSSLLNGQAMNPMQQNQYQSGSLIMNNNQFITDPDQTCYLTNVPHLDCLRDPQIQQYLLSNPHLLFQPYQSYNREQESQSSNQEQQNQPSYQQQPYQLSSQQLQYQLADSEHQYQFSNQEQLQYQSADQELQYQLADSELQYQSAHQELQTESANQELQYLSADPKLQSELANQELQYQSADPELQQSANQQQENQSANEQASEDIYATDVELIYPSLPYDPKEYFLDGHNYNL